MIYPSEGIMFSNFHSVRVCGILSFMNNSLMNCYQFSVCMIVRTYDKASFIFMGKGDKDVENFLHYKFSGRTRRLWGNLREEGSGWLGKISFAENVQKMEQKMPVAFLVHLSS